MEPVTTSFVGSTVNGSGQRTEPFADLRTDDFLKLMITQLSNQDPFEPTGNKELMEQISAIRNIESSTTLTDSLRTLAGQQGFTSASALLGQYVTGLPDEAGQSISGLVTGVKLDAGGRPLLQLSNGAAVPMDQVAAIETPLQAAERLVGKYVMGVDGRVAPNPPVVEGVVTRAHEDGGDIIVELESGSNLRFRDVVNSMEPADVG
ncbi:MAG: flagellar hook capping FlgD N-terminal domain-containing protein [Planctomycetota bacterium]